MSNATDIGILFRPFSVGSLRVENRVVMAPMTRQHSPEEIPGPDVAAYYARRAAGGAGLIISEGTTIGHPSAANAMNVPGFHGEAALAGWARVIEAVHAAGGKMFPQLWHTGLVRDPAMSPRKDAPSIGPSAVKLRGEMEVVAMTKADIDALVNLYAQSAAAAHRLGFDGVEIHGGHGFLVDQFFWTHTNKRTDSYGGSPENRARFAAEIVAACRAVTTPDFPISLRFSQWKVGNYEMRIAETPQELEALLAPIVRAGVSLFHCSTRRFWDAALADSELTLAGWTKKLTGSPVIAVGSVGLEGDYASPATATEIAKVGSLDNLVRIAERGDFDLIAVGRAMIVDPDWAKKVREGRFGELRAYDPAYQREAYF